MSTEHEAPQVNPMVKKAADQVAKTKTRRTSKPKAKDVPRWGCRGQLALLDVSGEAK
jgi:hypothetical protein